MSLHFLYIAAIFLMHRDAITLCDITNNGITRNWMTTMRELRQQMFEVGLDAQDEFERILTGDQQEQLRR